MKNLMIYGETHYRTNYLDQILLNEISSKTPNELKIVILDPSLDSLTEFEGSPHLLFPICMGGQIHDALNRICEDIEERKLTGINKPTILVIADRWLPKNDIECPGILESILVDGKSCGLFVWCSFDNPDTISEELRAKIDSFYAEEDSFDFDNYIYDKCLEKTNELKEKYGK